jgi:hypothetical protein
MAKQDIDIGVEGNDGTGDSIRESFRKVNDNFTELYAIFGLGGQISFTNLNDTPNTLLGNEGKVVLVKPDATGLDFFDLVSGAGTNDPSNPVNTVSFSIDGNKLIVEAINTKLSSDPAPAISNPLNLGAATAYNNSTHNVLLDDATIDTLVSNWNATHGSGSSPINRDNLLITKGYGDSKYVNLIGDTMTGPLNVPAGATGNQVPRVGEVVRRAGDTMTGALNLFDHPSPLNGAGLVNSEQDLQAATKFYVDSSTYSSAINLHVNISGNDDESLAPPGRAGRSNAYAYRTIAAACARAERIQQAALPDLGPYIQTITFSENEFGDNNSTINSVDGYSNISSQQNGISTLIIDETSSIIDDIIIDINTQFPTFVFDENEVRQDLTFIFESVRLDILASTGAIKHNYLSRFAGLRYFANPNTDIAISPQGQLAQTQFAINQAKTRLLQLIVQDLGFNSGQWFIAVGDRFDDILNTIDTSTPDPFLAESNDYYTIKINSGPEGETDQSITSNPDLIPGKVIRGKTSGAIGQIISYTRGKDTVGTPTFDTIELQLLLPIEFEQDEELEYANRVNSKQITIRVESGIYDEQLPIRVPPDVSIKGDEFRRVVVRPARGVSQSLWANTWFYRDTVFDGLTVTADGEQYFDKDNNLVGYFGRHYLTDPLDPNSTPLKNDQMDMFLMNDNTILRNITGQRHGGFMMVLDPAGQILTRSPYAQTCSSFSKSQNRKAFHGGMFIDGYSMNMPLTVISKGTNFSLNVTAPSTSGLGIRKPLTPCSFFIAGVRYQVNAIANYIADNGSGTASATLILDETSNDGIGFAIAVGGGTTQPITLQGGGNRSMLANDYTQINDLGYGIVATNNALTELVSMFTYYAHIGYYSRNGSQIRSLSGNNSYGNFGMVAEGSDPDEVSRIVDLEQNLVQPVKIYSVTQELVFNGDVSGSVSDGDQIRQPQPAAPDDAVAFVAYVSYNTSENKTTVFIEKNIGGFIPGEPVENDTVVGTIGTPTSVLSRNFGANESSVAVFVYDLTDFPLNASEIEILHASGLYQPYEVVTVSETGLEIPADRETDLCQSSNAAIRRKIWRLDLASVVATADTGLKEQTDFGTFAVYRAKQNFLLNGIDSGTLARPSTALVFDEQPDFTYRTIAFENTIVGSIQVAPLPALQTRATTDANFDYINLTVDNLRAIESAPDSVGTLGSTAGDTNIAIARLSPTDAGRIIGMLFTWAGVLHEVIDYQEDTDGPITYGIITIADVYSIDPNHTSGINVRVDSPIGDNNTLQAGLAAGATGTVTVNISTCRATGHDFLDIGTGGYNDTNYPDRIFGKPINAPVSEGNAIDENGTLTKAQVQERTRGRVFFASTDQDGFFRVGRFFTVDQGTGRVTFNAALVLTNIDGIGFKRGVRVNEFSPDTSFINARGDAVPTQTAVEGYIDRRLGRDRDGDLLLGGDTIPSQSGYVFKNGDTMSGDLNMGGQRLVNLSAPTGNSDAANKFYVDTQVALYDSLFKLNDVSFNLPVQNAQFIVYNGGTNRWNNVTFSNDPLISDINITYSAGVVNAQINTGVILNADVNANAAIAQSKLAMNAAATRANATGITQADRGLASFNSAEFVATNGWIAIADNGIANNKLTNSSITIGSTPVSLGGTVTTITGLTSVTSTGFTGNVTGNLTGNVTSTGTSSFGTLSATSLSVTNTITGSISGNAATTTLTAENTSTTNHYITFSENANGAASQFTDTGLRFTPANDILTIGTITLTGNTGAVSVGTVSASSINVTGNILPGANSPTDSGQNLGASNNRWNSVWATTFHGTSTRSLYADLAENYLADQDYEPGTVLIFGGEHEVTTTDKKGDRKVAGVVSTEPAHLMNSALEGDHVIALALQGRVPCKVLGRVEKGDLLVTSAIPGYAIVNNEAQAGTILGKAIENKNTDAKGWVEIVVGRV